MHLSYTNTHAQAAATTHQQQQQQTLAFDSQMSQREKWTWDQMPVSRPITRLHVEMRDVSITAKGGGVGVDRK